MKKKALFFLSAKGGVGKSTEAIGCVGYLRTKRMAMGGGLKIAAYDADSRVKRLAQACAIKGKDGQYDDKLNKLNPENGALIFDGRMDADAFSDSIDSGADILLYDLPGGLIDLSHVFGSMALFKDQFNREGYEIVVFNVLDQLEVSARSVVEVMAIWGNDVKHVAVVNHFFGQDEDFLWFLGDLKDDANAPDQQLLAAGGQIIEMATMDHGLIGLLDKYKLPYEEALNKISESRGLLKGWRRRLASMENFIKTTAVQFDKLDLFS
jgi:hypothetical protein